MSLLKKIIFLFISALVSLSVMAQLCSGNLGDPIVHIDFGSGSNPGTALPSAKTSYLFQSSDCPNDGAYTIRNSSINCFGSTWHSIQQDHTGNTNGYFMLVNAAVTPGVFYIDTVRNLCSGTTYELAAWIMNVLKPTSCGGLGSKPNLTFKIESLTGNLIQQFSTGDILENASPTWRQFGFFFSTPANASAIVFKIVNNATGGCGNDLAIDDITFRPCGPLLNAYINNTNLYKIKWCALDSSWVYLKNTYQGNYLSPAFQWQKKINGIWQDLTNQNQLELKVRVNEGLSLGMNEFRMLCAESHNIQNTECRVFSEVFTIDVGSEGSVKILGDTIVCEKDSLKLLASTNATHSWYAPQQMTILGKAFMLANVQTHQSGIYKVESVDQFGCISKDQVQIQIHPTPKNYLPRVEIFSCRGSGYVMQLNGDYQYKWQPIQQILKVNANTFLFNSHQTLQYTLFAENNFGCKDSSDFKMYVLQLPKANAGKDIHVLKGEDVLLNGAVWGDSIKVFWKDESGNVISNDKDVQIKALQTAQYFLTVTSQLGCGTSVDAVKVEVYNDIYIPNAFTPNNDGVNDVWNIPMLHSVKDFELIVYSRNGAIVHRQQNQFTPWDGKLNQQLVEKGVYVYTLYIRSNQKKYTGTLTIL